MKHVIWMLAGILAWTGLAEPAGAQDGMRRQTAPPYGELIPASHPLPFRPRLCPPVPAAPWTPAVPSMPAPVDPRVPISPTTPTPPTSPTPSTSPTPPSDTPPDFSAAGEFKGTGGRTSAVVAGTGLGGAVTGDPFVTTVLTPLVIPGLLTSTGSQSAIPSNRVYFEFGCFRGVSVYGVGSSAPKLVRTPITTTEYVKVVSGESYTIVPVETTVVHSTISQSPAPVAGFNLQTYNIGVEKTCFDGLASVYLSVPYLCATDNITGQPITGIGDINAGFKVILLQGRETGNTLTGGFTISLPTAHAASSTSYIQTGNGNGEEILSASRVSTNPTFLQPWLASLLVFDRLYVHQYLSIVVPSDARVANFLNYDFALGYGLYKSDGRRWLSSVTPMMSIHALIPMNHRGTTAGQGVVTEVPFDNGALPAPPTPTAFIFSDQVLASGGIQVGFDERWLFSASVVTPISAPRGYYIGATFGLSYYY